MIIDELNLSDLPTDPEEAFVKYVKKLRRELDYAREIDENKYHDINGVYSGNYSPDRFFVSSVLAFIDEYQINDFGLKDISDLSNNDFNTAMVGFDTKVNYLTTRLNIRKRYNVNTIGTPALIKANFKTDININLETVRKIVEQEITDKNKKDSILIKLSALQLEINRDRTSLDTLMLRVVEVCESIGDAADNLEPLIDKLERIKKLIFEGVKISDSLPKPERQIKLPAPKDQTFELDDDIPF